MNRSLPRHQTRVAEVMSLPAVSVTPSTPFKEIVATIQQLGVAAVPVVDEEGRVLGIVSESDLLLKEDPPEPSWFAGPQVRKAAGEVAAELMSSPALTVHQDAPVALAARIMHRHQVRSLPVLDDAGRLVGVVSRADLLKVFMRPDEEIRRLIVEHILPRELWMDPASIEVTVQDGRVTLSGEVDRRSDVPILLRVIGALEGVVAVHQTLRYRHDDSDWKPEPPPTGFAAEE